jgi:hypothetical protein
MDKKTTVLICVIGLLLGSVFYFWVNRSPIIPVLEAKHTDQIANEIKDTVETVTARIQEQDSRTRTEVKVIRETIRAKVNALPADDIVAQLNAELALFRRMEEGSDRMDGD